jgi:hypothetical protein
MNYKGGVPKPKDEEKPDSECLRRGQKIEEKEHPWAGPMVARRIAEDHLAEDPEYYEVEGEEDEDEGEGEEG